MGLRLHCCCLVILSYGHDLCHFLDKFLHLGIHLVIFAIYGKFFFFFSSFFYNFQFRIQNKIPFVLGCLLRFVGFDFVNFLILIFLVIFHISSLIFCFTRIRVFYGLLAFLWFLFLFICIVASKVFHNFININFKMFFLHSFWWTSIFLGN